MMIAKKVYEKLETEIFDARTMEYSAINALADSMALVYESIKNSQTTFPLQTANPC